MFEVMCSEDSELTRQGLQQGLKVKRFGLKEGDLKTTIGRRNLFCHLARDRPEHLWISPTCGPWCQWSHLNMSKSAELRDKVLTSRKDHLWQVSLARVLCDIQVSQQRHFHCEQPQGSKLLKLNCFRPIAAVTKPSIFDMCRVGSLREPISKAPIRKRLVVCTTSQRLFENLHNRKCQETHEHHQIAGTTQVQGCSMPLSKFTELYPRKFARQIIQCLRSEPGKPYASFTAEIDEHPTKRRRLDKKSNSIQIQLLTENPTWEDIMKAVDTEAPRVGIRVITEGYLLQAVQRKCKDKIINHLVLCRGMDRMVGPNLRLSPGVAPLRKFIGIRRRFEEITEEDTWEPLGRLSARQMRRPCPLSRCGLTVFARTRLQDNSDHSREVPSDLARNAKSRRVEETPVQPELSHQPSVTGPGPADNREIAVPKTSEVSEKDEVSEFRQMVDLVSDKHGPKFLALPSEERTWVMKIHKNMGHPNASKLRLFCQQMGCSQNILEALSDLRCSTCLETKGPEIAKPSAIHPEMDFGDVIGMDGIKWTSQAGKQFFFYRFVDQATTYHTAMVTRSNSSSEAIRALTLGWINWAGPPGTLIVDAGTEFGTEGFHQFLQAHDIRLRMIAPEAHWQNAKSRTPWRYPPIDSRQNGL